MKADTMITKEMLVEKGACEEGKERFNLVFQNGGKYQDVLNACDKLECDSDKEWLIDRFGEVESKFEFKVGDRVRIRQWDDMAKEYHEDSDETIRGFPKRGKSIVFPKGMKHLCGRLSTIQSIDAERNRVILKDWSDTSGDMDWSFSTEMLEPAVKEVKRPAKVGEWVKALSGRGGFIYKDVIYLVCDVDTRGVAVNDPEGKYSCINTIEHDFYVVLEGYEPPKEKAKEQPSKPELPDELTVNGVVYDRRK